MKIDEIIKNRGIEEVLHFTTNFGLTGILATEAILSRKSLPVEKYLEYVYKYNCQDRSRDTDWHEYINLSITKVNWRLFSISMRSWHQDLDGFWCIMAFTPDILTHPGVFFCTTNNIYTGVSRGQGGENLERLFADRVIRWTGNVVIRQQDTPTNQPTCEQAEVLYPNQLSLDYLKTIYVKTEDDAYSVESLVDTLAKQYKIDCVVEPALFDA